MNRQVRDPYAWWCERRTPLSTDSGAVYSIIACGVSCVTLGYNIRIRSLKRVTKL